LVLLNNAWKCKSNEEDNMAFCTKCGTQLADDANFCGKCGTPVGATVVAKPVMALVCPKCGRPGKYKFCNFDGATMVPADGQPAPVQASS
jgi:ribosomal protein L40E